MRMCGQRGGPGSFWQEPGLANDGLEYQSQRRQMSQLGPSTYKKMRNRRNAAVAAIAQ